LGVLYRRNRSWNGGRHDMWEPNGSIVTPPQNAIVGADFLFRDCPAPPLPSLAERNLHISDFRNRQTHAKSTVCHQYAYARHKQIALLHGFLNRNLVGFAKSGPTSVVTGKAHRALRTVVGLNC
jgi:hypothetical protein